MRGLNELKKKPVLYRFVATTQRRMLQSEIGMTSSVVAYYLLLSLFPLLIAVGNVLPYLSIEPSTVLPYIAQIMPADIFNTLEPAIRSLLTQRSGSLLSISALAALWSASKSINALQIAMNKAFGVEQRKNLLLTRLSSLLVMVLLLAAVVGVLGVFGLGKAVLDWLQPIFHFSTTFIGKFEALKWPSTAFVLLIIMYLIYRLVPNAKLRVRSVLPGAIFTTVGWLFLSQVFGLYLKYFSSKIAGYQIIGSFIVLMLWLNFAAIIMILGGIINAVVEEFIAGEIVQQQRFIERPLVSKLLKKQKQR